MCCFSEGTLIELSYSCSLFKPDYYVLDWSLFHKRIDVPLSAVYSNIGTIWRKPIHLYSTEQAI